MASLFVDPAHADRKVPATPADRFAPMPAGARARDRDPVEFDRVAVPSEPDPVQRALGQMPDLIAAAGTRGNIELGA